MTDEAEKKSLLERGRPSIFKPNGERDVQYQLGKHYRSGFGVFERDEEEAFKWFSAAAQQGHIDACFELGLCFNLAIGTSKDDASAVWWLKKAANSGQLDAVFNLGRCHRHGCHVAKDDEAAFQHFLKAAQAGHTHAQFEVAVCYKKAIGVGRDEPVSLLWLNKAINDPAVCLADFRQYMEAYFDQKWDESTRRVHWTDALIAAGFEPEGERTLSDGSDPDPDPDAAESDDDASTVGSSSVDGRRAIVRSKNTSSQKVKRRSLQAAAAPTMRRKHKKAP